MILEVRNHSSQANGQGALHKEARMNLGVTYSDGSSETILMEIRNW